MKPKTLSQRTAEDRAKILARRVKEARESGEDDYFDPYSTKNIERESKALSKSPAMKNLEPAITSLLTAHRIRVIRESNFEGPWIDDDDKPRYIDSIEEEIMHRIRSFPYQIYELGRLLFIVKYLLSHGEFGEWIEKVPPFSKSSALNYMRVYRSCLGQPEILDYFKRSALYKVCSPRFPSSFREFIFKNISGSIDANEKELLEIAIKWKKGEVTPKSPEVQSLLKKHRVKSESKIFIDELKVLKSKIKSSERRIRALNNINDPHPYLSEEDNEKDSEFIKAGDMVKGFVIQTELTIKDLEKDQ